MASDQTSEQSGSTQRFQEVCVSNSGIPVQWGKDGPSVLLEGKMHRRTHLSVLSISGSKAGTIHIWCMDESETGMWVANGWQTWTKSRPKAAGWPGRAGFTSLQHLRSQAIQEVYFKPLLQTLGELPNEKLHGTGERAQAQELTDKSKFYSGLCKSLTDGLSLQSGRQNRIRRADAKIKVDNTCSSLSTTLDIVDTKQIMSPFFPLGEGWTKLSSMIQNPPNSYFWVLE